MLVRKETVFSVQELRHVSITCPRCATEVVLDMANYQPPTGHAERVQLRVAFAPRQCPACKTEYDTALVALEDLQRAYTALAKLGATVTFHTGSPD